MKKFIIIEGGFRWKKCGKYYQEKSTRVGKNSNKTLKNYILSFHQGAEWNLGENVEKGEKIKCKRYWVIISICPDEENFQGVDMDIF